MRHEFHPEAALEFAHEVRFYNERGHSLGGRFAREVRSVIQRILDTPDRWRVIDDGVRRCRVRVFPHSVLYSIEDGYILIIAIAHDKRQPNYWRHRLRHD